MRIKKPVAIALLAVIVAPLLLFNIVNCIRGYLPPSEAALKTPYQFEEAFNAQMAEYGMAIDLDSANYGFGDGYAVKVVPVQCEDGSEITCKILTTSARRKSLLILVEFSQPYERGIPVHTKQLFTMLLRTFETPLYEEQDKKYWLGSYQDVMAEYEAFAASDEKQAYINVASNMEQAETFILERKPGEPKERGTLLLRLNILTTR